MAAFLYFKANGLGAALLNPGKMAITARVHKPPYTYNKTRWDRYSPFKWLAYWLAGLLVWMVETVSFRHIRGTHLCHGYDLNWWWLSWRDKGPGTHGKHHRIGFWPPSFK